MVDDGDSPGAAPVDPIPPPELGAHPGQMDAGTATAPGSADDAGSVEDASGANPGPSTDGGVSDGCASLEDGGSSCTDAQSAFISLPVP